MFHCSLLTMNLTEKVTFVVWAIDEFQNTKSNTDDQLKMKKYQVYLNIYLMYIHL